MVFYSDFKHIAVILVPPCNWKTYLPLIQLASQTQPGDSDGDQDIPPSMGNNHRATIYSVMHGDPARPFPEQFSL